MVKEPRRPSPRDPKPWPRSQEDLHQWIQGLGQGAKKTFTKGSKALVKDARRPSSRNSKPWPRRPSPRDPRPWPRSQGSLHQGIKEALGKGANKAFIKVYKGLAREPRSSSPRNPRPWPRRPSSRNPRPCLGSQESLHQAIQSLGQGS